MIEFHGQAHQYNGERGDFDRGVPAIKIRGRVRLGDAESLGAFDGFAERAALFNFREDDVGGGIEDAGKSV